MSALLDKLESEHHNEHQTFLSKLFTKPSIFPKCVSDQDPASMTRLQKMEVLKKYPRWYIRFKYRHPITRQLVRQPNIYKNLNRLFQDYDERLKHFIILRDRLERLLNEGYSPYENSGHEAVYSVRSAIDFALKIKKKTLSASGYRDYESRANQFVKFLAYSERDKLPITSIKRRDVVEYLNQVLITSSARNRNNSKAALSALFSVLEQNELIEKNFILSVENMKTKSKSNKVYSLDKVEKMFEYLDKNDPILFLLIKIVSYNFLRPIEVCRLRIGDVNLKEMKLEIKAKNKTRKYKRIPEILLPDFEKLNFKNPNGLVISRDGLGVWEANEESRRDYVSKGFRKVKENFNMGAEYSIYSFRHTFITKLHNFHLAHFSESEALDKTRLCTGHETVKALQTYLHNIDAKLAPDYSDFVK